MKLYIFIIGLMDSSKKPKYFISIKAILKSIKLRKGVLKTKRKRTLIVIALIILGFLAIGSVLLLTNTGPSPKKTVKAFMEKLCDNDIIGAYSYIENVDDVEVSQSKSVQDETFELIFKALEYKISDVSVNGNAAVVNVAIETYGMEEIIDAVLNNITDINAFNTADTEDASGLEEELWKEINEKIKSGNNLKRSFNVDINLKRVDKKWYIIMDDKLSNAITGGISELYSKMLTKLYEEYLKVIENNF